MCMLNQNDDARHICEYARPGRNTSYKKSRTKSILLPPSLTQVQITP
jgi:hypothetical protein